MIITKLLLTAGLLSIIFSVSIKLLLKYGSPHEREEKLYYILGNILIALDIISITVTIVLSFIKIWTI